MMASHWPGSSIIYQPRLVGSAATSKPLWEGALARQLSRPRAGLGLRLGALGRQQQPQRSLWEGRARLRENTKSFAESSSSDASLISLEANRLRQRRASRVLVVNPQGAVLLFEYSHAGRSTDALADKGSYYTVPGGGVRPNETFAECARRELYEETGIDSALDPRAVAVRKAPLMLPSSEVVIADEQYFLMRVDADQALDSSRWSEKEKQNIKAVHWCSPSDLDALRHHNLWPSVLGEILAFSTSSNAEAAPLEYLSTHEQIGNTVVRIKYP